jgi:toluene monooxygenase system protein E
MTSQRTYWHLEGRGRVPQAYDIATSKLLYHPQHGLEVSTPGSAWMQRYGSGTRLQARFAQFEDPRATTYARYVQLQAEQESFVDQLLQAAEQNGYDRQLSPSWLAVLEAVLPVLRYPSHALHMLAAYVAHMAPEGRVVVAGAFQAADELRRVQHLARRMRQLQELRANFGQAARAQWQQHPDWQPLRELLEKLLVSYDYGEAAVALNFVVKPALDELFMVEFAALARSQGDRLLAELAYSLHKDCCWQRDWTQAWAREAVRESPANVVLLSEWIGAWWPLTQRALSALVGSWGIEPGVAAQVIGRVGDLCKSRWQALGVEANE